MTMTETKLIEITVKVPKRLADMVQAKVASGQFADAREVVGDALRQVDERERQLIHLRSLLQEGLDSGKPIELTEDLWDEMWQDAEERHARGELPDPVVCP